MRPDRMPFGQREKQSGNSKDGGQQQHHGRETDDDEHDAEGCRPVAEQIDVFKAVRATLHNEQDDCIRQEQHDCSEAHQGLCCTIALVDEHRRAAVTMGSRIGVTIRCWLQLNITRASRRHGHCR